MNKQLKIKTRQFGRNIVILPIGFVVMLVLGGPSVQAQTTTTAPAAVVDSSVTLAAKGSVSDPNGAITVTGNVIVNCRRVLDTTTTTNATMAPVVLLDLDFSQLRGTSGTAKTLKTYVTGDNHASELRPFQPSDTIIVTSPYFDSTNSALSAR